MIVTADDVDAAVAAAMAALAGAADRDWTVNAGSVDWTCWETGEHVADDLYAYALQLGPRPAPDSYLPIAMSRRRDGAPDTAVLVEPEAGVPGLLQVVQACGALLSAMVRVTPASHRTYHSSGITDAEGYAAMGITEVLVHTYDICAGLNLPWAPDEALCDRVLRRLFPEAPAGTPRWDTFLWCTGRGELPGLARLDKWAWSSEPRPADR